jgi:hypothetical protein
LKDQRQSGEARIAVGKSPTEAARLPIVDHAILSGCNEVEGKGTRWNVLRLLLRL